LFGRMSDLECFQLTTLFSNATDQWKWCHVNIKPSHKQSVQILYILTSIKPITVFITQFLPMQCYASASISYGTVSVYLSVGHTPVLYQNSSTYQTLFRHTSYLQSIKEIRISPKRKVLPSGTMYQTLDLIRIHLRISMTHLCKLSADTCYSFIHAETAQHVWDFKQL